MDDTHRLHSGATIVAAQARYIKLGEGGAFAGACIEAGELGLSFASIPHDLCMRGDWEAVKQALIAQGRSQATATRQTGEIRDFYTLGADALWITFTEGRLWWCFAAPEVNWRNDLIGRLPRRRLVIGQWRSHDIAGAPLLTRDLSTRLSCIAGYRGAVCRIAEQAYLLRRINGEVEPIVREAEMARETLYGLAARLIQRLHDKEFELLVDLIFQASGWRRLSVLGESEKDIDLLIEQIATGERAFVQVKSRATPAVFDDYVERFRSYPGCSRMFFVCHSPSPALRATTPPANVDFWGIETIAEKALRAGLFDWLIERAR
jgi:hypothetical protein